MQIGWRKVTVRSVHSNLIKIHDERKDMIVERLKQYEDTYRDFDMYYE